MHPALLAGDLARGAAAPFRVRPEDVVVMRPSPQDRSAVHQRGEQCLVETLVTQPAVERFHERILRPFARRDGMPLDLQLLWPAQDRGRGQQRQAFAREVADHAQDTEAPAARKGIRTKSRLKRWLDT